MQHQCGISLHPSPTHTLTANLLYKAALREVVAIQDTDGSPPDGEEQSATVPFNPNTPHPYQLALGVLCIQKVLFHEPSYQFLSCKISRRKMMNPISFSLPVLGWLLAYSEAYAHIQSYVQLLQYLSEECGPCSLSEFKAFLENRGRIRTQLIEDLRKKRMLHYLHYFHTWERGQAYLLCTMHEECNYIMTMIGLAVLTYGLDWIGGE